jgi:hypothetical protein
MQYGIFAGQSVPLLFPVDRGFFTTQGAGMLGGWQAVNQFTSVYSPPNGGFLFGAQDANNPGVFPNAQFIYPIAATVVSSCPVTMLDANNCASPAVVVVGKHDGKYVILVSGIWDNPELGSPQPTPSLFVLLQK